MKKRFTALLCLLALICTLFSGCGQGAPAESTAPVASAAAPESGAPAETREFTDSCGRTVALPAEIKKIAVFIKLQFLTIAFHGQMNVAI